MTHKTNGGAVEGKGRRRGGALHGIALAALVGVLANAFLPASLNSEALDAHPIRED